MINIGKYEIDLKKIMWLKPALYAAAMVLALSVYYFFTVRASSKEYVKLTSVVSRIDAKNTEYGRFKVFQGNLLQRAEDIKRLLASYEDVMSGASKSQNSFFDLINRLSMQAKIKIDTITPQESNGKKILDINFKADYKSICEFFSLVEKYLKIESFTITSGQMEVQHKVNLKVSALSVAPAEPGQVAADDKKDIFDLYIEVSELLKGIETRSSEASSVRLSAAFDPMLYTQTIFIPEKKPVEQKKKVVVEEVPFKIEGIYWDPSTPVVVINGQALKEKEEYNGAVIEKINEDNVSVTWKGKKYKIKKIVP